MDRQVPVQVSITAVPGIPAIDASSDLPGLIVEGVRSARIERRDLDVFVIAQKVVSKAEGRLIALESVVPSPLASRWAADFGKDPRLVELVFAESRRIVRMDKGILISETHHGFVCANAGIDMSNVDAEMACLLPEDPDRSAAGLRTALEAALGVRVAVIIADTFGRPWREGLVNVALGVSGIDPIVDLRGKADWLGGALQVTTIAIADEIASAAELVMKKNRGAPVAIVRGIQYDYAPRSTSRDLIRAPERDLFR